MRIVLTGATGLTGAVLLTKLRDFAEVWCLGREDQITGPSVHNVEADLSEISWQEHLPNSADVVIYLAQSRQFRDFPNGAMDMQAVNTRAPLVLANWAVGAGVKKIIYASTGGVYAPSATSISENGLILAPTEMGFYPASKFSTEMLLLPFRDIFDLIILRPFFIYGQAQDMTMLIPRLIANVRDGVPILLDGENGMRINPIHVDDVCDFILSTLNVNGSDIVNVAGKEVLSLREIGEVIGGIVEKDPVFETTDSSLEKSLVANTSRMDQYMEMSPLRFDQQLCKILNG